MMLADIRLYKRKIQNYLTLLLIYCSLVQMHNILNTSVFRMELPVH